MNSNCFCQYIEETAQITKHQRSNTKWEFNPNRGGGLNHDIHGEIGCYFMQEALRDLKILDFFKNDARLRVKESF